MLEVADLPVFDEHVPIIDRELANPGSTDDSFGLPAAPPLARAVRTSTGCTRTAKLDGLVAHFGDTAVWTLLAGLAGARSATGLSSRATLAALVVTGEWRQAPASRLQRRDDGTTAPTALRHRHG